MRAKIIWVQVFPSQRDNGGEELLKTIIIEDIPKEAQTLTGHLHRYGQEIGEDISVKCYPTADEFLEEYTSPGIADFVFMDIKMPGMDGLHAAQQLRKVDPDVFLIFVTSIAKYAVYGYKVDALDYFLKPVKYYDLKMRMDRVLKSRRAEFGKKVKLPLSNGVKLVDVRDMLYVESDNHKLIYHTRDGMYSCRGKSMKEISAELEPHGFMRCNSCYLVNLKHCTAVRGSEAVVGDDVLQISRAKRREFIEALAKSF